MKFLGRDPTSSARGVEYFAWLALKRGYRNLAEVPLTDAALLYTRRKTLENTKRIWVEALRALDGAH